MQPARYGAASAMPDTTAPGGFGESSNQAKPVWDVRLKGDGPKALLTEGRDQLMLTSAVASQSGSAASESANAEFAH